MLNNWEKKEKPIQGMMGMGGGATGYLVVVVPPLVMFHPIHIHHGPT